MSYSFDLFKFLSIEKLNIRGLLTVADLWIYLDDILWVPVSNDAVCDVLVCRDTVNANTTWILG